MRSLADDLHLALEMADLADSLTLPRFRDIDLAVDTKPDLTPVTEVDRGAEWALRELITGLDLHGTVFRSNHASNFLALEGNLPRDRERLLGTLDRVLADPAHALFKPAWMRGL